MDERFELWFEETIKKPYNLHNTVDSLIFRTWQAATKQERKRCAGIARTITMPHEIYAYDRVGKAIAQAIES